MVPQSLIHVDTTVLLQSELDNSVKSDGVIWGGSHDGQSEA